MSHHSSLSSGEGGLPPVSIDLQQLPPGQLGPPLVRNNLILPLIGSVVLVKLSYKETFKLTDLHHNIIVHCTALCLTMITVSSLACGVREWWWCWTQLSASWREEDHLASVAIWPGARQEAWWLSSPLRGFHSAISVFLHQSKPSSEYLVNQDSFSHIISDIVIARGFSRNCCFYILADWVRGETREQSKEFFEAISHGVGFLQTTFSTNYLFLLNKIVLLYRY